MSLCKLCHKYIKKSLFSLLLVGSMINLLRYMRLLYWEHVASTRCNTQVIMLWHTITVSLSILEKHTAVVPFCTMWQYYYGIISWSMRNLDLSLRTSRKKSFFFHFQPSSCAQTKKSIYNFFLFACTESQLRFTPFMYIVCGTIFHWWWQFGFNIFPKMYLRRQWEKRKRKNAHHSYYFLLLINYIIRCLITWKGDVLPNDNNL